MTYFSPIKNTLLTPLLLLGAFTSNSAHAENKLFPTDVLDKGQVDARLNWAGYDVQDNFEIPLMPLHGRSSLQQSSLSAGMRYGLGASFHIGADVTAGTSHARSQYDGFLADAAKASGIEGGSVWAKYGLLTERTSPLSLSGEMGLSSHTTNNLNHSSYNELFTSLAAGWRFSSSVSGYMTGRVIVPDRSSIQKQFRLSTGAWINVGEGLTVIPSLTIEHFPSIDTLPARDRYGVDLGGIITLQRNTYLMPSIGYSKVASVSYQFVHDDGSRMKSASLGLYHLY